MSIMYTITDSICLKILSTDCLLVAIGTELHYYQQIEGSTVHKFQVTDLYDKIHGIQSIQKGPTEFHVIIYGGRELALFQIKNQNFVFVNSVKLSDWISNIKFYDDESNSFCCLTSHSVALHILIVWDQKDAEKASIDVLKKLSSEDKSTLYSSFIHGKTWEETVFFGGTALGYVFVWSEMLEMHRLDGHNGVIFSIDCNIEHGIMTTTSDDRSVKIWNIFPPENSNTWIFEPKLYGHTARVFRCKIIVEDNVPYVISIGEDSNICVWSKRNNEFDLYYRRQFNCGAALWNLDYNPEIKTIFLCGSDGNVREVALKNVFNATGTLKEIAASEVLQGNEYLSKVKIMKNGKIIALTSANRLIYQNIRNDWTVCPFDAYKSCVLEKYDTLIAIAGYQRASVFTYDAFNTLSLVYEVTDLQSMVRSFTFLNDTEYLLCDDSGNCAFINRTSNQKLAFSLLTSKDAYVTVALKKDNFLLVGDRTGDLHLYEIEANEVHHRHRLKQVHGNLGCTVLYAENGSFFTSGHDGTLKLIALNETCKTMSITMTKKLPVSWMERVICRSDNKKLYAGFNVKRFVLANDECDIVDEIDCGGGHRCWDLSANENGGTFIFIRKKRLSIVNLRGYADDQKKFFRIPLIKWHMKSCNSIKCIDMPNGNVILVSGGDDNVLKLHKFRKYTESFVEHMGDMVQHISCIKTLAVVELNATENLIVSAGGRAQICITKITANEDEIITKEVSNFMLNSSDVQRKRLGKTQTIDFDPETRFMSVACTKDFQIFTGCSDGYIRQFSFSTTENEITPVNSIFYGKCVLHTHHFARDDNKYLLTMATDGNICFWEINSHNSIDSEPFYRLEHHKSGINSFDIISHNNRFSIATGGDDQSTVVSSFLLKGKSVEEITIKYLHYHTAQVNGIKFSSNGTCLYTISVDQILFEVNLQTLKPRKIGNSTIADAKGLHLLQNNEILVYGSGIQLIKS